jgi:hypothetical protein
LGWVLSSKGSEKNSQNRVGTRPEQISP